jgi:hypothetical protein
LASFFHSSLDSGLKLRKYTLPLPLSELELEPPQAANVPTDIAAIATIPTAALIVRFIIEPFSSIPVPSFSLGNNLRYRVITIPNNHYCAAFPRFLQT